VYYLHCEGHVASIFRAEVYNVDTFHPSTIILVYETVPFRKAWRRFGIGRNFTHITHFHPDDGGST
jgi:hypothetical protein